METIIELAKRIPRGTKTETKPYPVADKVPEEFLSQLGIELENESNYVLVLEIQFDTEKIILQEYDQFGENYAVYSYRIEQLPITFKEWLRLKVSIFCTKTF